MPRRNWNRIQPTSLRHALELCKDYARIKRNLSVERIAEGMGLADHWTLYKWLQTGRIPVTLLPPYESVCGINYVTRWIAASGGQLLIAMPTGRLTTPEDIQALQSLLMEAMTQIIRFRDQKTDADTALAAIAAGMSGLAWHHHNIEKYHQPELELGAPT